ncbi:unnamed protein product, partial [Didymodactylos carnosus]
DSLPKYSGGIEAESWLNSIISTFSKLQLRSDEKLDYIPITLQENALFWYQEVEDDITSFGDFIKLFCQKFVSSIQPVNPTLSLPPYYHRESPSQAKSFAAQKVIWNNFFKNQKSFAGKSQNIAVWIKDLELQFKRINWPNDQKVAIIPQLLKGDALQWFENVSDNITTWKDFKSTIINKYTSRFDQSLAYQKIKDYHQAINQSVEHCYFDIMELCDQIDPNMSDKTKL